MTPAQTAQRHRRNRKRDRVRARLSLLAKDAEKRLLGNEFRDRLLKFIEEINAAPAVLPMVGVKARLEGDIIHITHTLQAQPTLSFDMSIGEVQL